MVTPFQHSASTSRLERDLSISLDTETDVVCNVISVGARLSCSRDTQKITCTRYIHMYSRYSKVCEQPLGGNHPPIKMRAEDRNMLVLKFCRRMFDYLPEK